MAASPAPSEFNASHEYHGIPYSPYTFLLLSQDGGTTEPTQSEGADGSVNRSTRSYNCQIVGYVPAESRSLALDGHTWRGRYRESGEDNADERDEGL